jgi:hypothetical protein
LDGVGIGPPNDHNPFFKTGAQFLPFYTGGNHLPDGTPIKGIDARLGTAGTPQSATGQTTLFTGINVPARLGEHRGSYPNRIMRQIILQGNLLTSLQKKGLKAKFINAYPVSTSLFTADHIKMEADGSFIFSETFPQAYRRRLSTTTCMLLTTGEKPFDEESLRRENSLYQDFSNKILIEKGLKLPLFTPEKAAGILHKLSKKYDFILYEYFQTDLYAHRYSRADCIQLVQELDRFIGQLISHLDKTRTTLILTSDHGNIEDLRGPGHTTNPVPLLIWGRGRSYLVEAIDTLDQVTPQILKWVGHQR